MTDLDLFGEPPTVHKNAGDYLVQLSQKTWPDGLEFWCLSPEKRPRETPADSTEMVCFRTPEAWLHCAVDINTGQILQTVRRVVATAQTD